MKNKLFLTGERGVGKSTLINRFTQTLDFDPYGFQTLPSKTEKSGRDTLIIRPYSADLPYDRDPAPGRGNVAVVASRGKHGQIRNVNIDAFEKTGAEILRISLAASGSPRLIIMDELGFMESEAYIFQSEVFRCLDGRTPVLGLLRAASTPFLDGIRVHDDVVIIEVTVKNREQIFEELLALKHY